MTSTPMKFGDKTVPQIVVQTRPSIWRPADAEGVPKVNLPAENPKYPETKHTVKYVC